MKLVEKKGWTPDFSYKYSLEKISGGMAILESYKEFIMSNVYQNSIFYKYAIGDVVAEYHLYQKVKTD